MKTKKLLLISILTICAFLPFTPTASAQDYNEYDGSQTSPYFHALNDFDSDWDIHNLPRCIKWMKNLEHSLVHLYDSIHPKSHLTQKEKIDAAFEDASRSCMLSYEWGNLAEQYRLYQYIKKCAAILEIKPQASEQFNKVYNCLLDLQNSYSIINNNCFLFSINVYSHSLQFSLACITLLEDDLQLLQPTQNDNQSEFGPGSREAFIPIAVSQKTIAESFAFCYKNMLDWDPEDVKECQQRRNETKKEFARFEQLVKNFLETRNEWLNAIGEDGSFYFDQKTSYFLIHIAECFGEVSDF